MGAPILLLLLFVLAFDAHSAPYLYPPPPENFHGKERVLKPEARMATKHFPTIFSTPSCIDVRFIVCLFCTHGHLCFIYKWLKLYFGSVPVCAFLCLSAFMGCCCDKWFRLFYI